MFNISAGNNPGAGDWYCDANFGNNIWCPEYDTFEGNKHTLAGTLHTCDGNNYSHIYHTHIVTCRKYFLIA